MRKWLLQLIDPIVSLGVFLISRDFTQYIYHTIWDIGDGLANYFNAKREKVEKPDE